MRNAAVGLTILNLFILSNCGGSKEVAPAIPPVSKDAVAGQITSQPCVYKTKEAEFAAQCGFIYVPENRTKPGSRLIALPYQRILAQTRKPSEPLFPLTGGPGQSNMAAAVPVSWFAGQRDVVLVGYRGIDGTVRLDCPEVDGVVRHGGAFTGSKTLAELGGAYRQCAARLEKAGIDLSAYGVLETVDDLEAVRKALGYGRIDLGSVSYGTRVALIYDWRYPGNVMRSAMIGVNPPGRFWFDPVLLDAQLRHYATLCTTDAYCSSRTKDLAADIKKAQAGMPALWWGVAIDRDKVLLSSFMALYSTNGAAAVFEMWIAAAKGDYSGMALVTTGYSLLLPKDMVWGESAAKAYSVDFDSRDAACRDLTPGRTLLGSPLNVMACAGSGNWPDHKISPEYRTARPSDVETLMLSGSLDVSTPAENARNELLPLMKNAKQVTLAEFSHAGDLLYYQPEATRRLLTAFYDTGRVDASLYRHRPVNFNPGWMSFPLIAKALAGAVLVLTAAILWLAVWLIRRRFGSK
jgi:pimeloyl-ACP methyl ester carboxylesterase